MHQKQMTPQLASKLHQIRWPLFIALLLVPAYLIGLLAPVAGGFSG